MQLKRILKAAFKIRNIALLAGVVIVAYLTEYLPFAFVGAAGYLFFVLQSLKDKSLDRSDSEAEKIDSLLELDARCGDLYREARNEIDRSFQKKVEDIVQDKDELMELFQNDQDNYIKQKVTEQVLKLVMAYISLTSEYNRKRHEVSSYNTAEIIENINANMRKLNVLRDAQAIEDMKHAIEIDKRVLDTIDQEKRELEKMSARLAYIESTLKTFKHQVQSSENTDETATEIENIINEATALDQVLTDSRKERMKV